MSPQDPTIALPAEHLTYDELEAYVDGRADADDRAIAEEHTAQCALCRDELAQLVRVQSDLLAAPRPSRKRWLVAAAAVLLLAAAGAWMFLESRKQRETPVANQPRENRAAPRRAPELAHTLVLKKPAILDALIRSEGVLRGTGETAFALLAPVGTVVLDERPAFRWEPVPGAASYDIAIADVQSANVAASGTSTTAGWRSTTPLPRGRTFTWQVTAHTAGGTAIVAPAPSAPEALFHVATTIPPLPQDPRERGVALANAGALDDAERALAEARATELLRQVRAWRHGRPTATNGAQ